MPREEAQETERRLLKVRVPVRLALALEAHRLLSGDTKSSTVEEALKVYLKEDDDAIEALKKASQARRGE